jgi:ATP-binding cassette subfamily G (WHITE) protein 2 (SNQ2)
MDIGRQVFYGPPAEARAYFEGLGFNPLPRQSTADYLSGCTDPNERQYAPGRSARDTPSLPKMLKEAYLRSKFAPRVSLSLINRSCLLLLRVEVSSSLLC